MEGKSVKISGIGNTIKNLLLGKSCSVYYDIIDTTLLIDVIHHFFGRRV